MPAGGAVDRPAEIAAAAADLFAEYGYEPTTMRQIADRVGMLAGSLYNHFATKEDMLHAIMRARVGEMVRENLRIAGLPLDAERRLIAIAILRIRHYVQFGAYHTILLQEGNLFRRHADFAYVVEAKTRVAAAHMGILTDGVAARQFRAGIDPYLIIGMISRMLSGIRGWFGPDGIARSGDASRYTLDAMIDFNLDSILRLVRTPDRLDTAIPRVFCEGLLGAGDADERQD